jgi:hypothetical protein
MVARGNGRTIQHASDGRSEGKIRCLKSIWILRNAQDRFFSPHLKNSNARWLNRDVAGANIEVIFGSGEKPPQ